ncbi:flagellar basal body P-ring formation chaperone FlgA [Yoonia sediminilitoris]|uniref:Flagella basal body P-ring formation protein FlgA n=1 Tax=Yoonia sediminilitoris TaxID=1286148 RepID=A0A2T6KAA3_9RHOB|nr:flagellar basal body P-ring formation chaperone FlgA [Yoonia sediminilitoris]PUB11777.1 flagella basal body P-ring formation protein FlgA [Yoonia sediminilitoris]RCW91854.1 flagella basal body P-ring formation protein FlgA [Yoonia sediminilitoris]
MKWLCTAICFLACPAVADVVVAARTIPAQTLIGPEHLFVRDLNVAGAISDPEAAIGLEARVALYAGRPIRPGDVGPPAVVERNQLITLHYQRNGLMISTDGRALGRAGPGDIIRVMNLSSRSTVSARIGTDGAGYVAK